MREWVEEIADYMQEREEVLLPLNELSEEMHQMVLETDQLIEASNDFQTALSSILEKYAER